MTMTRQEAIQLARKHVDDIATQNYVFSNINANRKVWWTSIPIDKAAEPWVILLHDQRIGGNHLYIFVIPAGFFSNNTDQFKQKRLHGKDVYNLFLSTNEKNLFQDVTEGGKGVNFCCFLKKTVDR